MEKENEDADFGIPFLQSLGIRPSAYQYWYLREQLREFMYHWWMNHAPQHDTADNPLIVEVGSAEAKK